MPVTARALRGHQVCQVAHRMGADSLPPGCGRSGESRGKNGDALAAALKWPPSKISRYELTGTGLKPRKLNEERSTGGRLHVTGGPKRLAGFLRGRLGADRQ